MWLFDPSLVEGAVEGGGVALVLGEGGGEAMSDECWARSVETGHAPSPGRHAVSLRTWSVAMGDAACCVSTDENIWPADGVFVVCVVVKRFCFPVKGPVCRDAACRVSRKAAEHVEERQAPAPCRRADGGLRDRGKEDIFCGVGKKL